MTTIINKHLNIQEELESITEIPTLPHVVIQLIALLDDPEVDFKRIAAVIEEDPPLVAQMLKVVNSGFYGLPNTIDDLHQALVLLGLDEIQHLVFAESVYSVFYHVQENDYFDYHLFWQHCIGTARLGYALAAMAELPIKRSIYTAGLLHDIGRLVLQLYFPEMYEEVFNVAQQNQLDLLTAETSLLNFTHTEAGYWIAQKWNLPDTIKDVIRNHHLLDQKTLIKFPIRAFTYFANELTRLWGNTLEVKPMTTSVETTDIWKQFVHHFPQLAAMEITDFIQFVDIKLEEADTFVKQLKQTKGK